MLRENRIWMATGSKHKFEEGRRVLLEFDVHLERMEWEREEIQSDDPAKIATHSMSGIPDEGFPVLVEDAGLFIEHYDGFPGPYSSYALKTISLPGILKLMEGVGSREATFRSVVAFRMRGEIRCFHGVVKGEIAQSIRGTSGFGYDPIFIPEEGDGRTFGEMSAEEKDSLSHRARAFRSLGEWLSGSEEGF
ncbi:MAG: RdgB/HAM1 family non-canonical purine NTP pyrophosphatase [Candidatus Bathyarchaeota archaeon]|nr:MAG: RdgB/HAM1 family non-canonical purine NTP pyrophosphatase [Candidatus Bathyarchaeota archaeon]